MDASLVQKAVRDAVTKAGLTKRATCHTFRHSFPTHLLEASYDIRTVQETLMIPLWARDRETEKNNPIVCDTYTKNIVERIDYDFSQFEEGPVAEHQGVWAIRAYNFDNIVEVFLSNNSRSVVVNIGAGLDTTFQRVDEGTVLWINIDLPDVVALRQKLFPDSEREMTIAKSIFDFTWIDDISRWTKGRSILFMAAGVLCYIESESMCNFI